MTPRPLDVQGGGAYSRGVEPGQATTQEDAAASLPHPIGKRRPPSDTEQARRKEWGSRMGKLVKDLRHVTPRGT